MEKEGTKNKCTENTFGIFLAIKRDFVAIRDAMKANTSTLYNAALSHFQLYEKKSQALVLEQSEQEIVLFSLHEQKTFSPLYPLVVVFHPAS